MRRLITAAGLLVTTAIAPAALAQPLPSLPELPLPQPPASTQQQSGTAISGLFALDAGKCAPTVSGTYFRMIVKTGSRYSGPYVDNNDSPCTDRTYTPLRPGTDGGLSTSVHQPNPTAPFDGNGNGLAERITRPQKFFGVNFATATNSKDPQTGASVGPPQILRSGTKLSGDIRSFAAAWNSQHFNQGAPKPDGTTPGNTTAPTGTYDASTDRFSLEWASQIVGGPFDGFTGVWHFEGTFRASGPGTTAAAANAGASKASANTRAARVSAPGENRAPSGSLARTGPIAPLAAYFLVALGLLVRRRWS